jgi:YHS domain-containing protein
MKTSSLTFILLLAVAYEAFGQSDAIRKMEFNIERSGLALDGYDPVSYFSYGRPVDGKEDITFSYHGVLYRFGSTQNRETFKANPAKYEPQYGGWCAYAMGANGEKVEIDPGTFKIVDGKLYLFYNKFFTNTLESWNKDEARLKPNADENWLKIIQQK